jgi:endonuclease/exonuclease/phosphatase family metal-dependent hydrolase
MSLEMALVREAVGAKMKAIATSLVVLIVVLAGWTWAVFALQPFGQRAWAFTAVSILLAGLTAGLWLSWRRRANPRPDVIFVLGRPLLVAGTVLALALAFWLGLIAWSELAPGGFMPPSKSNRDVIRVLTWNILLGKEAGVPWRRHGWPVRRKALEVAIAGTNPDILCVQEALAGQLTSLAALLPRHRRVGVGRDDGRSAGEHCAIFFERARFEELEGGTFWLEEPTETPPATTWLGPKRICTWVRLRDRETGRFLRIYNTHLYLTERARLQAVAQILARMDLADPMDAVLVAADFNADPDAQSRRLLEATGLVSTAERSKAKLGAPTYQFYGIRLRSLDDILVNRRWLVLDRRIVDLKPGNIFPSDHFGVMADLILADRLSDDSGTAGAPR